LRHISSGFDQEAAAVLIAKMAVYRQTGNGPDVLEREYDTLIRLVSKLLRKLDTV
jgi:hypothetical protein